MASSDCVLFYILLEQIKGPPFHFVIKQVRKENLSIVGGVHT